MKKKISTAAVVVNAVKPDARASAMKIAAALKRLSVDVIGDPDTAGLVGEPGIARDPEGLRREAQLAVSAGGDGTVLRTVRTFAGTDIPVLGLNMGRLGFLTAATVADSAEVLEGAVSGDCVVEERLLLSVTHMRDGETVFRGTALNDAVINKGLLSRVVNLDAYIAKEYLATYVVDGLIVSTPTGSTAYSLSAGGPLVSPETDAIIITPICPHTLTNRPLIIPSGNRVRIAVSSISGELALTLDGQVQETLREADEVWVEGGGEKLRLIVSPGKGYYQLLREKLSWGGHSLHGKAHH